MRQVAIAGRSNIFGQNQAGFFGQAPIRRLGASSCDQIPENRLLDRFNCENQAFRQKLQAAAPILREPYRTPPSTPASPSPGTTGQPPAPPPTPSNPNEIQITAPPAPEAPFGPGLPPGPSNTLPSWLTTQGVAPGIPLTPTGVPYDKERPPVPSVMTCPPGEYWDPQYKRCFPTRIPTPTPGITPISTQMLQPGGMPMTTTGMTTSFSSRSSSGPVSVRPPVATGGRGLPGLPNLFSGGGGASFSMMGRRLGQTRDDYLRQMLDIQKRLSAAAESLPAGNISKEKVDAILKRLDGCQPLAGTQQGVDCMKAVEADFQALVKASMGSGIPTWGWIAGGAAVLLAGGLAFGLFGRGKK